MATKDKKTQSKNKRNSIIQWHPAFRGGIKYALKEYKDDLTINTEYVLSTLGLQMDLLITKKESNVEIKNQIGVLFRKHNIIEYKSPDDGITIDDYIKTIGYAFLYKGLGTTVEEIPLDQLTVTLCRDTYPRKLMKSIEKYGGLIRKKYPGVYYVTGLVSIPSQIIVTKELEGKEHIALRIISNNAKEEDVRLFLEESKRYDNLDVKNFANAVLAVSSVANSSLYSYIRRDLAMRQTIMEIMSEDIKEREEAAAEEASTNTLKTNILNLMDTMNLSAEEAMDALKVPAEKRELYTSDMLQ